MKHLYILVFILSFFSVKAQNWQAVYSDRLVFFDSSRQAIKIVSVSVDSTGDSTFKNYPNTFIFSPDTKGVKVIDSASWIGRKIIVKQDGYNGFANDSNEVFWLNTLANTIDTFIYFDSKKLLIKGYCNQVFYADTFGVIDSIKQFKFVYNNKPDTTREILLSKHHGLLKTPFYCSIRFPQNSYTTFLPKGTVNYFPENYFTNRRFNNLEIGDEYEYKITNDEFENTYFEDRYYYQVIKKEVVPGTDSIKYTFFVRKHAYMKHKAFVYPDPNKYHWKETINHYVYNETKTLAVNDEPVNGWLPNKVVGWYDTWYGVVSNKIFYLNDNCNSAISDLYYGDIKEDTTNKYFSPPFESNGGKDYHSKIGELYWYLDGSGWNRYGAGRLYEITYRNFCNAQSGSPWAKYYVYGVGVEDIKSEEAVIFPNPAKNTVSINANEIQTVKLYDLSGKEIQVQTLFNENTVTVNISNLLAGIYYIRLETEEGISTHKLIVQH